MIEKFIFLFLFIQNIDMNINILNINSRNINIRFFFLLGGYGWVWPWSNPIDFFLRLVYLRSNPTVNLFKTLEKECWHSGFLCSGFMSVESHRKFIYDYKSSSNDACFFDLQIGVIIF